MKKLYYTVYLNLDKNTKLIKVYTIKQDDLIPVISFTLNIMDISREEIYDRVGRDSISSLTLI